MIKSILDYLDRAVNQFPDKTAFVSERESVTYREFDNLTKRTAAAILRTEGAGEVPCSPGPVAVFLEKSVGALAAFMGIVRAGGIYTPFDTAAPIQRLNKIVNELCPSYVITDQAHYEKAKQLSVRTEQILLMEDLTAAPCDSEDEKKLLLIYRRMIDTDPLYIICTSGSTGVPKGVVVSHRAVIDFTEEASEQMEFSERERFASQAPFYFDASVPDIYCTLRNCAQLHIIPASKYTFPVRVLEYMKAQEINAIFWVPSALICAANVGAVDAVDLSCLKKVMFCGEVMPVKQYLIWKKALPDAKFVNYYGPSEATYASAYYVIDREFREDEKLPIGSPAVNTHILVLNESDELVSGREVGELCIRGSGLALGYYNNPEKTAQSFVQNPLNRAYPEVIYRTGDLVCYNDYGELEYVGRKDFQIKHQGYRIELGEIETAAASLETITRCACVYDSQNERIVLFYTGKQLPEQQLRRQLTEKLPKYMVPGVMLWLKDMPYNANGKVDRRELKSRISGR